MSKKTNLKALIQNKGYELKSVTSYTVIPEGDYDGVLLCQPRLDFSAAEREDNPHVGVWFDIPTQEGRIQHRLAVPSEPFELVYVDNEIKAEGAGGVLLHALRSMNLLELAEVVDEDKVVVDPSDLVDKLMDGVKADITVKTSLYNPERPRSEIRFWR